MPFDNESIVTSSVAGAESVNIDDGSINARSLANSGPQDPDGSIGILHGNLPYRRSTGILEVKRSTEDKKRKAVDDGAGGKKIKKPRGKAKDEEGLDDNDDAPLHAFGPSAYRVPIRPPDDDCTVGLAQLVAYHLGFGDMCGTEMGQWWWGSKFSRTLRLDGGQASATWTGSDSAASIGQSHPKPVIIAIEVKDDGLVHDWRRGRDTLPPAAAASTQGGGGTENLEHEHQRIVRDPVLQHRIRLTFTPQPSQAPTASAPAQARQHVPPLTESRGMLGTRPAELSFHSSHTRAQVQGHRVITYSTSSPKTPPSIAHAYSTAGDESGRANLANATIGSNVRIDTDIDLDLTPTASQFPYPLNKSIPVSDFLNYSNLPSLLARDLFGGISPDSLILLDPGALGAFWSWGIQCLELLFGPEDKPFTWSRACCGFGEDGETARKAMICEFTRRFDETKLTGKADDEGEEGKQRDEEKESGRQSWEMRVDDPIRPFQMARWDKGGRTLDRYNRRIQHERGARDRLEQEQEHELRARTTTAYTPIWQQDREQEESWPMQRPQLPHVSTWHDPPLRNLPRCEPAAPAPALSRAEIVAGPTPIVSPNDPQQQHRQPSSQVHVGPLFLPNLGPSTERSQARAEEEKEKDKDRNKGVRPRPRPDLSSRFDDDNDRFGGGGGRGGGAGDGGGDGDGSGGWSSQTATRRRGGQADTGTSGAVGTGTGKGHQYRLASSELGGTGTSLCTDFRVASRLGLGPRMGVGLARDTRSDAAIITYLRNTSIPSFSHLSRKRFLFSEIIP